MATITVKKSGGNHNTITKAVNAAKTGDTIIVYAGVYKEQIRIHTSGLTIKANSGDHVEVSGGIELTNRSNPNTRQKAKMPVKTSNSPALVANSPTSPASLLPSPVAAK